MTRNSRAHPCITRICKFDKGMGLGGSISQLVLLKDDSLPQCCWLTVKGDEADVLLTSPIATKSPRPKPKGKKMLYIPIDLRSLGEARLATCKNRCAVSCGEDGLLIFDISNIEKLYKLVPKLTADLLYDKEPKRYYSEEDLDEEEE